MQNKLSILDVRELEQLYDIVQLTIEQCPTITWAELCNQFPEEKLCMCLRYCELYGAEDGVRTLFVSDNQRIYVAQEYAALKIHAEIMEDFAHLMRAEEDVLPW